MRAVPNILNYWQHFSASKRLIGGLFLLALLISAGLMLQGQTKVQAASCSANDVIRCGVSSAEDFQQEVSQNSSGDLNEIYSHYGINADDVAQHAVEGTAYQDGTIKVDGRTVATDVVSMGRSNFSYAQPVNINDATYYESTSQDVFNSEQMDVLVVMDENQQFQYAIIKACGNPAVGQPAQAPEPPPEPEPQPEPEPKPRPSYECTDLDAIRVDSADSQYTYRYEVDYAADNGATLEDAEFDFGNGETQTNVMPDAEGMLVSEDVTYTEPGDIMASATLYFEVNGEMISVSDEACQTSITIPMPEEIEVCRNGEIITIPENERRGSDLPPDSEACQAAPSPPELPETGALSAVGGALGAGSIAGAGYYFRASRRNLLDSVFKK